MQSTLPIRLDAAQTLGELRRTFAGKMLLSVSATAFVALCAHVSLPLYFTPVPLTLQTFAVILVGLTLGPALGFSAMVLYLAEGTMGLPVFSPHGPGGVAQLLGPTAGYLYSYPFAAALAGGVVRAFRSSRFAIAAAALGTVAATIAIFAMGAGWIARLLHLSPATAWHVAIAPFLPGEIVKIAAVLTAYTSLRRWVRS